MPRKTEIPAHHQGLSARASHVIHNAGLTDKESVSKAIDEGLDVFKLRMCGVHTAQEILDWIGRDREVIEPKLEIIDNGRVKIGRGVLSKSHVMEILAAMK